MQKKRAPLYIRLICLLLFITSLFLGYLVYHDKSKKNKAPALNKLSVQPHKQPRYSAPITTHSTKQTAPALSPLTPPATHAVAQTTQKAQPTKTQQAERSQPYQPHKQHQQHEPTKLSPPTPSVSTANISALKHTNKKQQAPARSTYVNTGKPKVAIIIDDIGYGEAMGRQFIDLPYPLSYAFIPFSPYGQKLALQTHDLNKLVMLHAPMATINNSDKWEDSLHPNMSKLDIRNMLDKMLLDIPHVQGVNNHGGSLFTQSAEKMPIVFNKLKKRGLFFVDSRTSAQTVGLITANKTGLAFAERDVFLDNSKDKNDINVQIDTLITTAKKQGYAIGIAHPYMETYTVLKERLNTLALSGVELVPVSLLVH